MISITVLRDGAHNLGANNHACKAAAQVSNGTTNKIESQ